MSEQRLLRLIRCCPLKIVPSTSMAVSGMSLSVRFISLIRLAAAGLDEVFRRRALLQPAGFGELLDTSL